MNQHLATRLLTLTIVLALLVSMTACTSSVPDVEVISVTSEQQSDLTGIKSYLLDQIHALQTATAMLEESANSYYALAATTNFDYAILWQSTPAAVVKTMETTRQAWLTASPLYEKMEGIVAGVPALSSYDLILDAGASGAEDPNAAVPFDLTLPDGRVLVKPGNLFGVTESTLWGTFAAYTASGVEADLNGNGAIDFGETLPDANVLKAGAEALNHYTTELLTAAEAWEPTASDAFTALVIMIPTMNEYFGSWRDSRFVAGDASSQRDFVAISRLADMQDILSGLEVVFAQVHPLVATVDAAQAEQVAVGLQSLRAFIAKIYTQEQGGKRFTPEEADLLGEEAQNQATALTGQISQLAAQLGIQIQ